MARARSSESGTRVLRSGGARVRGVMIAESIMTCQSDRDKQAHRIDMPVICYGHVGVIWKAWARRSILPVVGDDGNGARSTPTPHVHQA